MTIVAAVLAALAGLALGLLGGGGSVLAVPVFVYVLGFTPREAVAAGLVVVGAVSLAGAAGHWRAGNVSPRPALAFGAASMAGSLLGTRLAAAIPGTVQLFLFAVVMLVAAVFMLRGRKPEAEPALPGGRGGLALLLPAGVGLGVLTGLLGAGGGFLAVPALVLLAGLPMRRAVGTSLAVIAMSSAAGVAGYLGRVPFDWTATAGFAAVAVLGTLVGVRLAGRLPQRALQRGFALFLVAIALTVLYQNRGVVLPHPSPAGAPVRTAGR